MRTRIWVGDNTDTKVQFRNDADPKVWMNTNIGWIPIGNAPTDDVGAEAFAVDTAKSYGLPEGSLEEAKYWAGIE